MLRGAEHKIYYNNDRIENYKNENKIKTPFKRGGKKTPDFSLCRQEKILVI